jgi:HEAT repeats
MLRAGSPGVIPSRARGPMESGRLGVRTLLLLIGTSGAVLWAARIILDTAAPVQRWAREVRQGGIDRRREAALRLRDVAPGELGVAVPALAAALRDDDEAVVVQAAESLGQAGQASMRAGDGGAARAAVEALAAALGDRRQGVRTAALGGLSNAIGTGPLEARSAGAIITALVGLLRDESPEIRSMAAGAFRPVGQHNPIPPPAGLVAALEGDRSAAVRASAAHSLGQFRAGRDAATLALIRALGADEPQVRAACDEALNNLRFSKGQRGSVALVPALIVALAGRERRARYHAAAILGEIGSGAETADPALVVTLTEPADPELSDGQIDPISWDPGCQAASALGAVAPGTRRAGDVVGSLVEVVRTPGLDRRRAMAAEALVGFDSKEIEPALPVLLAVLGETVGNIGPPAPSVCMALGRAAAATPRSADAVAVLTKALDSGWAYTRCEAAQALAGFGGRASRAVPRLGALATGDEHRFVRDAASSALFTIGETTDRPAPH